MPSACPCAASAAVAKAAGRARDMIRGVQRDLGRLDILVNNVGIQHVAPVHEFPDDKCGLLPGAPCAGDVAEAGSGAAAPAALSA